MKLLALVLLLTLLPLSGCSNLRVAGEIRTDYGSIRSDGKTITLVADYRNQK